LSIFIYIVVILRHSSLYVTTASDTKNFQKFILLLFKIFSISIKEISKTTYKKQTAGKFIFGGK